MADELSFILAHSSFLSFAGTSPVFVLTFASLGVLSKLREAAQSQTPLKPRIEEAQKKLQVQIAKLEGISSKMQEKDKVIFGRIVKAMQNHDSHYGKLLSGELSQVRKMIKMIDSAKAAFKQLQLRLNTMTELGDVV
jgi:division protein CdvB (Snf7/Vps24/ESCRT-III family)